MGKMTKKNLILMAGVMSLVTGIMMGIPAFLRERDWLGAFGILIAIGGIILIGIALGD